MAVSFWFSREAPRKMGGGPQLGSLSTDIMNILTIIIFIIATCIVVTLNIIYTFNDES